MLLCLINFRFIIIISSPKFVQSQKVILIAVYTLVNDGLTHQKQQISKKILLSSALTLRQ